MISCTSKCISRWNCSPAVMGVLLISASLILLYRQRSITMNLIEEHSSHHYNLTPSYGDLLTINKTREKYFIIFLIPSHPDHGSLRQTIRQTWSNVSGWRDLDSVNQHYKRIKIMFLFGTDSKRGTFKQDYYDELQNHPEDMFQVSGLKEERTVLKYKVLWGMKEALYRFDFDYIVKTDDDIAVNLPHMISALIKLPRERYYSGNCAMVYGGFRGWPKWKYCSGGGYMLTRDVISKFQELPSSVHAVPFRPEDAYTGYLVSKIKEMFGYDVKRKGYMRMKMGGAPPCGPFLHWFYHCCKSPSNHLEMFERMRDKIFSPCEDV